MFRQIVRQLHGKGPANRIVLAKDESCFIAFHPRKEHPYEYTRPLPKEEKQDESVLKVNSKNMITEAPNLEQVQDLTFTHKSRWRNQKGLEKREKLKKSYDDNVDRRGLTS